VGSALPGKHFVVWGFAQLVFSRTRYVCAAGVVSFSFLRAFTKVNRAGQALSGMVGAKAGGAAPRQRWPVLHTHFLTGDNIPCGVSVPPDQKSPGPIRKPKLPRSAALRSIQGVGLEPGTGAAIRGPLYACGVRSMDAVVRASLAMKNRRAWIAGLLAAVGLKAQTIPAPAWIAPGAFTTPACPVCHTLGSLPGTAVVVANPDGSVGATLPGAMLFICQTCGCLFAGFVPT
jgi:hypothetical protein